MTCGGVRPGRNPATTNDKRCIQFSNTSNDVTTETNDIIRFWEILHFQKESSLQPG